MNLPPLPEADPLVTLMPAVRKLRDEALRQADFRNAVMLSHVHAWLHWANEVLNATNNE